MMNYPNKEFCMKLFEKYFVPENIKRHCIAVSKLGKFLAEKANIDVNFIESACLLHDVMKVATFESLTKDERFGYSGPDENETKMWKYLKEKYSGMHETEIISEILKNDYPEFASFMYKVGLEGQKDLEILIVQYSDMRIRGDKIVSIEERLQDLKIRYNKDDEWYNEKKKSDLENEKKILDKLQITQEAINDSILQRN